MTYEASEQFPTQLLCCRVMAFVQKAVARLHEPEKLEKLLQDLGKKHYSYGAKAKYVDVSTFLFIVRFRAQLLL